MEHLSKKEWDRLYRENQRLWSRSEIRRKALQASIEYWYPPKKDGSPGKAKRIKGYTCDPVIGCGRLFEKFQVQVDHIIPRKSGKTRLEVLSILWCTLANLTVLCKKCHQAKTNKERKK